MAALDRLPTNETVEQLRNIWRTSLAMLEMGRVTLAEAAALQAPRQQGWS